MNRETLITCEVVARHFELLSVQEHDANTSVIYRSYEQAIRSLIAHATEMQEAVRLPKILTTVIDEFDWLAIGKRTDEPTGVTEFDVCVSGTGLHICHADLQSALNSLAQSFEEKPE